MIRYSLVCVQDHAFESWFRDSAAFDTLSAAEQVGCPVCSSTSVRKALMAPSVVTSRAKAATPAPKPEAAATPPTSTGPTTPQQPVVLMDDKTQQMRAAIRELHQRITANADDVGRAFATEARAIHDGAAPGRSIYGEATRDEVSALLEDGIPLMPMPMLPDEHH